MNVLRQLETQNRKADRSKSLEDVVMRKICAVMFQPYEDNVISDHLLIKFSDVPVSCNVIELMHSIK